MSQQRTKHSRIRNRGASAEPAHAVTLREEPIGDYRGHLAIGLAAVVVTIVGLIVAMIILAAT